MPRSVQERFWSKVDKTGECWVWTGSISKHGYGCFGFEGKTRSAHRLSYEFVVGPIPAGLDIDHLCRNRACVNPSHMEPVTRRTNTMRGLTKAAENASKKSCPSGHEYTPENTYTYRGMRQCRMCRSLRDKSLVQCLSCGLELGRTHFDKHRKSIHPTEHAKYEYIKDRKSA